MSNPQISESLIEFTVNGVRAAPGNGMPIRATIAMIVYTVDYSSYFDAPSLSEGRIRFLRDDLKSDEVEYIFDLCKTIPEQYGFDKWRRYKNGVRDMREAVK